MNTHHTPVADSPTRTFLMRLLAPKKARGLERNHLGNLTNKSAIVVCWILKGKLDACSDFFILLYCFNDFRFDLMISAVYKLRNPVASLESALGHVGSGKLSAAS